MEIVVKIIFVAIFVAACCFMISEGINKQKQKLLEKQKELNKQIFGLYRNEQDRVDILWKIILHIRQELSLLKLKECPDEELKNIPLEIINWIDLLEKVDRGDNNGIHK